MKTVSESDYKLIIEVLSVFANQAIDSRDTKMLNRQRRVKMLLNKLRRCQTKINTSHTTTTQGTM